MSFLEAFQKTAVDNMSDQASLEAANMFQDRVPGSGLDKSTGQSKSRPGNTMPGDRSYSRKSSDRIKWDNTRVPEIKS